MKLRRTDRLAAVMMAMTLTAGTAAVPVYANTSTTAKTAAVQSSIGSVSILTKSTIEIKNASILASDEGNLLAFTFTVHNRENSEIQLIDYWVRLLSKSGTSFSVQLLPGEKDKNRVPANSSMDIRMYAKLNANTTMKDLIFRIVRWDFSVAGYERKLGDLTAPATYNDLTPVGAARVVNVNGVDVKMTPSKTDALQNGDFYEPKLTLSLENTGIKTAELPSYQFSLRTKEGLLYPLTAKGLEDNSRALYPRFKKDVELSGKIPLSVGKTGWQLIITTQADAVGGKLNLPVAFFQLPTPGGTVVDVKETPAGTGKNIIVSKQTVETKVEKITRTKLENQYNFSFSYMLKNNGNVSVTLPAYRLSIQTSEGLTYPVKADGIKDLVIDPRVQKEVKLTAAIPSSISATGWKLLLLPPVDAETGAASEEALAVYQLPDSTSPSGSLGSSYTFTNKGGTYSAMWTSIQRLPWEDQDILTANLTISNRGSTPLPIPELSGYFLLDNVVKVPAQAMLKDSIISVRPNGTLRVQLYGKIPYHNDYSSVKLVLQEKTGDNAAADLLEFRSNADTMKMAVIPVNGSYRIENTGRQSSMSIRDVRTFTDGESDLYSVQVSVQNLEKRYTSIGGWVAYLVTEDEMMYPATVSEIKGKVSPGGTAVLNVAANLPPKMDTSKLKLIMGAGVKDGQLTNAAGADAYVDAVSFALPSENKEPKKDFTNIDIFPYTLNLTSLRTTLTMENFDLKIRYKLTKNGLTDMNLEGHKIIVEYDDRKNEYLFSKSFTIGGEGEGSLAVGEHDFTLSSPRDPVIMNKFFNFNTYTLRVYQEYKGQKKLLAEKVVDFVTGL